MKIETVSVRSIVTNRDGLHNYFGWPTVARLKDGRLAVVASGFRYYHKCPFGKDIISFSPDEGKTWSLPAITFDTPLDDRDSGVVPFGESGVLVTSCNCGADSRVFMDGCDKLPKVGAYIAAYLDLMHEETDLADYEGSLYRLSYDNGHTFGEIRHMPVSNPHGPVALDDGSFLWVGNAIDHGLIPEISCWKLYQDGTCEKLSDIAPVEGYASFEPYATVLKDGTVLVHIRVENSTSNEKYFTIFQSESHDGGKSFTVPHSIGLTTTSGAPAHILQDGDTLISVYAHRNEPHELRAAFSFDGGCTWDGDHVIASLPDPHADFGYPSSVVLKDGSMENHGTMSKITFWAGKDTPIYTFPTPVVRQVIWRYEKD